MSLTGLMATGARTVLMSRWRPGGQSSFDLVREFTQELPYTYASDAWQRAVMVVGERPLQVSSEPRVNGAGITVPPHADHPFFWSAFMLVDTGAPPKPEDPTQVQVKQVEVDAKPGDAAKPAAGAVPPGAKPAPPPPKP
jgi:hypothetical protein